MENETYLSQVLQMSSLMDNYIESHIYHHAMGSDAVTDTEEIISGTLQSAEKPTSLGRVIEALEDSTNPVPETVTTENNENIPANTATVQEESLTSGNYTDHQSSNFDKSSQLQEHLLSYKLQKEISLMLLLEKLHLKDYPRWPIMEFQGTVRGLQWTSSKTLFIIHII